MESPAAEDAPAAPLVSDAMAVLCLKAEYVGNANGNFMHGIDALNRRYEGLRRVRGDGNCFFRGFIFALCEQLLPAGDARDEPRVQQLRARVQETIRRSKGELVAIGYSEVAIDAFWETFVDYLAAMETRSHAELVQDFQTEGGESEYLVRRDAVWYARLLTAGYLKKHAEDFQPFVEGLFPGLTVEQFCAAEVEPMGKECDQPQIAALTEALQVGVKIEYLDGSAKADEELQSYICAPAAASPDPATSSTTRSPASSPRVQTYSGETKPQPVSIFLLYRPGHYDILYPRGAQPAPVAEAGDASSSTST